MQALAGQDELDFAVPKTLVWVNERLPGAAVPGLDRPGAVVAFRDAALEIGVVQRMVLDMHRDPFVGGVEGGAFADRPAPQHVVVFQAEVPVQAGAVRLVLLHDEHRRALLALRAAAGGRFRRRGKVAFGAVGLEGAVA